MRIIFLEAVQDYGGARISTLELAERLAKTNFVSVIDLYGSCKPFTNACKDKNIELQIVDYRDKPFIIKSSSNKLITLINLLRFVPHVISINKKLNTLISNFEADYIILNNSKVLSFLFYKKTKAKTIFFARGWFIKKQISLIDRILYRHLVNKFVCISEATRQALYCSELARLENLYVVHNAIEEKALPTEIAEIADSENCIKLIHCGGFLPTKGQHISIEIAKELKAKDIKFKLILAGIIYQGHSSIEYYKKITNLIKKYQLESKVLLITNKSNVIDYIRACDILIHPSETEGLPRVVMEAMILKKPVIANPVGGVTDYILNGYTGFLAKHNDINDYVYNIYQLTSNKTLYNFVSSNAYSLIKNSFTPEMQTEKLIKVFQD